ncbi:DUF2500 domain-containing protein [Enterococcus sp. AD013-P3]|uniref:DUF2500 domain-containing protein n=1 Tax=Enterococcus sp. AD013-P3 TaxID=3411036 RepID=UPI003B92A6DB
MVNDPFFELGEMPILFKVIPALVVLLFVVIIGTVLYRLIKNVSSPKEVVLATLIDKNAATRWNGETSYTDYMLIFEDKHGKRIALDVNRKVFSQLVVGDSGRLTYQGSWFKDFERVA